MSERFNRKTFIYLQGAGENRKNRKWFEKNQELFNQEVKAPFTHLLNELREETDGYFPDISFHPGKISLPVYRDENIPEDGTIVKPFSWAFLSEKKTSLYEWNPGINIYIGEEITIGMGLYYPSSRQMGLLRESIMRNPSSLTKILSSKRFQGIWGEIAGEKYRRFPRDYDREMKGGEFLWHKQFFVTRKLTRKDLFSPELSRKMSEDLITGATFLHWLRSTVGVYEKEERVISKL